MLDALAIPRVRDVNFSIGRLDNSGIRVAGWARLGFEGDDALPNKPVGRYRHVERVAIALGFVDTMPRMIINQELSPVGQSNRVDP